MKAGSVQAESPKDQSTGNESDEEAWGDKLVIDLDTSANMTESKTQAKSAASSEGGDSDNISCKSSSSYKTSRADAAASSKQKGKRNGQKKGNDSIKNDGMTNSKLTGRPRNSEKEKVSVGKPGRKKKEKQSPVTIKTEAENADDPYKFEPADEKIGSTAVGKSDSKSKSGSKSCKDAQTEYDWRSVGSVTEPEHLGPCEPGTQVCLEGIVWQETSNGVLVVNVTWKGKTYMGTLLDATKHDWSPPSCDSPTGDFEGRTPKGRGKRSRVPLSDTFKDINERKLRKEMRKQSGQTHPRPRSPISPKSESGKRKVRGSECDSSEPTIKRGRNIASFNHSPPALIECPEPNCGKKYKQMNGLKYHQRNAHHGTSPQVPSDNTSEESEKPEPASSPEDSKLKSSSDDLREVVASSPTLTGQLNSPVRSNTTSVITPTTSNVTNTTTPPSGIVPVATITPQVVKPVGPSTEPSDQNHNTAHGNQFSASNGRPGISSAPPKPISKPSLSNSAMAPISTITSPVYNSTLKPIQPKPTIMGEAAPNPGLHDLIDQKKLKRKRSLGKEEIGNTAAYSQSDSAKSLTGGMHMFETEHRGLLSTGGMINSLTHPSSLLQSPAYSDISDEGDLKFAARRELLTGSGRSGLNLSDSAMHSQNPYPIATVSPQKNAPMPDKDSKKNLNRQMPSQSPVPSRNLEDKQRQLHYLPGQSAWPPQEILQQMMQSMASKDKGSRPVSPKPNSFKPTATALGRDIDPRVSGDRLQLLKEDMKASAQLSRHDAPRDYTVSPNTSNSNEMNSYHEAKQRDYDDAHKRELMKNLPSANKYQTTAANKLSDSRLEKMTSRSSPMPPPGSFLPPYSFLPPHFMQINPMLARMAMPATFPSSYLNTASDNKDSGTSALSSFTGNSKSNHKIHELEGVQSSKSPRPVSNERHNSSKNQSMTSQAAAMHQTAMLGMNPALAGIFQHPK